MHRDRILHWCISSVSLINIYRERDIDLYKMWLGFQALATRLATLHNSAMPGPPHTLLTPHPDTNAQTTVYGDDDTPRYKPRDSARSALLTADQYVADDRALPCTPEGYYTAPRAAAPDWRGEIRVGRMRQLTQRSRVAFD